MILDIKNAVIELEKKYTPPKKKEHLSPAVRKMVKEQTL